MLVARTLYWMLISSLFGIVLPTARPPPRSPRCAAPTCRAPHAVVRGEAGGVEVCWARKQIVDLAAEVRSHHPLAGRGAEDDDDRLADQLLVRAPMATPPVQFTSTGYCQPLPRKLRATQTPRYCAVAAPFDERRHAPHSRRMRYSSRPTVIPPLQNGQRRLAVRPAETDRARPAKSSPPLRPPALPPAPVPET